MTTLGQAVFGFDSTLSLQHIQSLDTSSLRPRYLNPFVDAQALVEADAPPHISPVMNALEVERYLRSKGAKHLNQEFGYIPALALKGNGDGSRESSLDESRATEGHLNPSLAEGLNLYVPLNSAAVPNFVS